MVAPDARGLRPKTGSHIPNSLQDSTHGCFERSPITTAVPVGHLNSGFFENSGRGMPNKKWIPDGLPR